MPAQEVLLIVDSRQRRKIAVQLIIGVKRDNSNDDDDDD